MKKYIRKDLQHIRPYSSARDEFEGTADVWLDANENALVEGVNRYPDPLQRALKKEIARVKDVPESQLFLGNGSDEVLDLLLRLTCRPFEDTIAFFDPSYGMYEVLARLNGLSVKRLPLDETFGYDLSGLQQALWGVRALFICRPNNPTGNLFSLDDLKQLLANFNGVAIVDEAYIDFCPEESAVSLVNDFPNLVVVQTLSKAYAMAGLRIGMAIAGKEWIAALNSIKPPYNISTVVQEKAIELLRSQDWEKVREAIVTERKRLFSWLEQQPLVEQVFPSAANFVLFRVNGATRLYNYLLDQGVVVRDRSSQFRCENTLRVTVGTAAENERFMNAFNRYNND